MSTQPAPCPVGGDLIDIEDRHHPGRVDEVNKTDRHTVACTPIQEGPCFSEHESGRSQWFGVVTPQRRSVFVTDVADDLQADRKRICLRISPVVDDRVEIIDGFDVDPTQRFVKRISLLVCRCQPSANCLLHQVRSTATGTGGFETELVVEFVIHVELYTPHDVVIHRQTSLPGEGPHPANDSYF